jgi:hypothetical protein
MNQDIIEDNFRALVSDKAVLERMYYAAEQHTVKTRDAQLEVNAILSRISAAMDDIDERIYDCKEQLAEAVVNGGYA